MGDDLEAKSPQDLTAFPKEYYDDAYYAGMAAGGFEWFKQQKGRALPLHRLKELRLAKLEAGTRLLDLGCGRGESVMFAATMGIDAYGIDYSPNAIAIGSQCVDFYTQEERQRIHLVEGDITKLPFPDSFFNRVTSWAVLEHLYPHQMSPMLREIHRVLKPNGVAVMITDPNDWYEKYGYRIIRSFKQLLVRRELPNYHQMREEEPEHVNPHNPISLRKTFEAEGFACKVSLLPRLDYEVTQPLFRLAAALLEQPPLLRNLFCTRMLVVGAKDGAVIKAFLRLQKPNY